MMTLTRRHRCRQFGDKAAVRLSGQCRATLLHWKGEAQPMEATLNEKSAPAQDGQGWSGAHNAFGPTERRAEIWSKIAASVRTVE